MGKESSSPTYYIRAKRPDGSECVIDLMALEDALSGGFPGEAYLLPDSGEIRFINSDFDEIGIEDEEEDLPVGVESLPIDAISDREHFRWMEEFSESVRSVPLRATLGRVLSNKKPFRNFRDALMEYPAERERWSKFEAEKTRAEAIGLIESFDWEILEVVDPRPTKTATIKDAPEERVPITEEEHEWILRGASEIATSGGRSQLGLLLKGSKNKKLLKHNLQASPAYGQLSFLTLEEIENRIDHVIRKGDLRVEFFGDLPLIVLSDQGWDRVRPWANQNECNLAAVADERTLREMLRRWTNRRRDEQLHLVNAAANLSAENRRRVLEAWRALAGKDVRARIEQELGAE